MSLPVSVAQIISSDNKDTADAYDVTRIPRFFLFRNGTYDDFPLLTTGEAFIAGELLAVCVDHDVVWAETHSCPTVRCSQVLTSC
jgi:hypothetical protein